MRRFTFSKLDSETIACDGGTPVCRAAAIAAARHVGVPPSQAIVSLASFENVKRRMETRGVVNGVSVIDDFAHHPTAIATTVGGLRRKIGNARILAVLEPRSNTMKLGTMKEALPGSLAEADLVFGYGAKLSLIHI